MTKLTQQEIKKEREMFEIHARRKSLSLKISFDMYESDITYSEWNGWLARAELVKGE